MRKKVSLLEDSLIQMLVTAIAGTLAKLAQLKTAGLYQEAQDEIDQNLEELLGLKADILRRLSDEHILEMLTINQVLDVGRLHYLAELFREEGAILQLQGKHLAGKATCIRALNLFLETAFAAGDELPGIFERIDALFETWCDSLPEDTLFTLFDYYEKIGAFAKAVTAIDQMLIVTKQHPDITFEKKAFYGRLLQMSDQQLEAGGLTRHEIEVNSACISQS